MKQLKNLLQSKKIKLTMIIITIILIIISVINPIKSKYNGEELELIIYIKTYKIENNLITIKGYGAEPITIYLDNDNIFETKINYGDYIKVKGTLKLIKNETIPNIFNYKKYANSNHEFYTFKAISYEKLNKITLRSILYNYSRYSNDKYINKYLFNSTLINEDIENLNIMTLFTAYSINLLLFKNKYKKLYLIILLFLLLTTDFSIKIILLLIMLLLKKIRLNYKEIFFYILLIKIIINPRIIILSNFYYSLVIYIGIIILINNKISNKLLFTYILNMFLIPLSIYNTYTFNICFFLLLPLFSIILIPLGLLISIVVYLIPILSPLKGYFNILELFISIITKLSIFNIYMSKLNIILLVIIYLLILLFIFGIKHKIKPLIYLLPLTVSIHLLYPFLYNYNEITFIDVGQGDASIIRLNHINILVDTGGVMSINGPDDVRTKKLAKNISTYLHSLGINKLDYLILTHGDFDHLGSSKYIIDNIKINKVLFNNNNLNNLEQELVEKLKLKKIKYEKVSSLIINDLHLKSYNSKEENESSIMIYLKNKYLLLGDATIKHSIDFIKSNNISKVVLKVSHHGSKNNTNEEIIKLLNPRLAIISAGLNNIYNHPSKEVLAILNMNKVKTYTTINSGSIKINLKNGTILKYEP